ncbi:Uncharacterized protein TCM_034200 [Theobroma cacao]|uniref:Uncharacterized protein n=1 Tax=Theobroma cacao TaxID=3641 RepID=A0A061FKF9_THECC|nr:Uncharacterized protein TCM_034200 [Theobroma cacao]
MQNLGSQLYYLYPCYTSKSCPLGTDQVFPESMADFITYIFLPLPFVFYSNPKRCFVYT